VKRKEEIFHRLSRFLLVQDLEQKTKVVAFCMFRFENEEGENVVYWYAMSDPMMVPIDGVNAAMIFRYLLSTTGWVLGGSSLITSVPSARHSEWQS